MSAVKRPVALLLNVAHALDHMFLLIFATAVTAIAADFGFPDWESLMPYGVGAFMLFGLGSLPAGRLGDLWGRRPMMLVFFVGMGLSALLIAVTRNAWELAAALTLMGLFSSIYHPVGIPMLVRGAPRPGPCDRHQRARGEPRRRLRRRHHGISRQVRGLARGVRRSGRCLRSPAASPSPGSRLATRRRPRTVRERRDPTARRRSHAFSPS